MSRSTPALVNAVLAEGSQPSDTSRLQPFLDAASSIVDQKLLTSGLDDPTLIMIETHLAAHYWVASGAERAQGSGVTSTKLGPWAETLSDKGENVRDLVEAGLLSTSYGRLANTLSGGLLANIGKQPARFVAL